MATPDVISPELALVCPQLREAALRALPLRDPDLFLARPISTAPPAFSRTEVAASVALYLCVTMIRQLAYGFTVAGVVALVALAAEF